MALKTIDLSKEKFLFKRLNGGDLVVLNCFPNTYEVGMASLGYQTVFKLFASSPKTHTFRCFTDFHEYHPKEIDLITFSISWELDFFNVLEILQQLGIPFKAKDRDASHPLICAGGPVVTANPEPWADFFDFINIGDSENNIDEIIDTALTYQKSSAKEKRDLNEFTKVPGVYVPSLKQKFVERQKSKSNQLASSSVVTSESCWPDVALIEVARSCPEMCRFCLASYLSLPFRVPDLEEDLIPKAKLMLEYTNTLGLLGASVTQHPEFIELLKFLAAHPSKPQVQIASVRASTVTKEMCELLQECGVKNLTIAIESGSERLRDIINKKLPQEYIFSAAKYASEAGIKSVKLYGMVGLPHETDADIDETIKLLSELKAQNKKLKIIWGCSIFTPKAQTPFQDYGVDKNSEKKLQKIIKALRPHNIEVREESYKWAQVQALISRGDRSLNDLMIEVFQTGKRGFSIYQKLMDPVEYKHFVFDTWSGEKYPWKHLMSEKQSTMLQEHKASADSLS